MEFDIPSGQIANYSVFSIRGGKEHPEGIEKDALYDWSGNFLFMSKLMFRMEVSYYFSVARSKEIK